MWASALALMLVACAPSRPTPTPDRSAERESPLLESAATQVALSPAVAPPRAPSAGEKVGPPGAPEKFTPPPPEPTPTPMPGSAAPPTPRVRLRESVTPRREPRADAQTTPLGRAPARLVAEAREVLGDWVRIEAGGISGWVPRSAVEFLP